MSRGVGVGWDPGQYDVYADERSRPFHELVAAVRAQAPGRVVDLGCGDGRLTAGLAARWPGADVLGIDSSAEMLAGAPDAVPGLSFRRASIEDWDAPAGSVDVLVSNAAFQWVPAHPALLARWVATLPVGGWLAFQVPGNFGSPSHTLLAGLIGSPRWAERLAGLPPERAGVLEPADYLDRLTALGCRVDAWETTYLHVLPGDDAILDWVRGTALRPVLTALAGQAEAMAEFEREYGALLREAYPRAPYGTVFPFRRIFVTAERTA
jgi:trans-aconitate 2-methyltransferase